MGHFDTTVNGLLQAKAKKDGGKWDISKAFTTVGDAGEEFGKIVVSDVSIESKKELAVASTDKVDSTSKLHLTLEGVDMANVEGGFDMNWMELITYYMVAPRFRCCYARRFLSHRRSLLRL